MFSHATPIMLLHEIYHEANSRCGGKTSHVIFLKYLSKSLLLQLKGVGVGGVTPPPPPPNHYLTYLLILGIFI
jgi:hypothetical protein